MKELYFIRHGETDYNKMNISQGSEIDSILNEAGINQAKLTGRYLNEFRQKNKSFDCIISSNLKRAYQTANIIADEINYKNEIIKLDILKEVGRGKISGLDKNSDLFKKTMKLYKKKLNNIKDPIKQYNFDIDKYVNNKFNLNMEETEQINKRVIKVIEYIENSNCNKIIIISHSSFIYEIIKKLFNQIIIPIDTNNNNNCYICYIIYKNNKYIMKSPINTKHLDIKYD
jgi:broad specificity phosphatase PhoE